MSRIGQIRLAPARVGSARPVAALALSCRDGQRIPRHRHRAAQLIAAVSGVMTVSTRDGRFVVPPQRAVWVPPDTDHAIRMVGEVALRTLYVAPARAARLPVRCCVVQVTPLLRELVLRVVEFPKRWNRAGREARIAELVLDEIEQAVVAPLHLPLPADPRSARVTRALRLEPGDPRTLAAFGRAAGASPRTLARLFQRETGMGFRAWRQQLRLLRALERLAAGEPVTRVALDLGYASPSAFGAMFRRTLGVSPGRYFRARGGPARAGRQGAGPPAQA
jgi:AraC-like DNA-binding protein/mannose-6-phosphate isomerase-like protein (cupin superfamily)